MAAADLSATPSRRAVAQADLLVVAPATADLMAKMAHGHADDLASTVLLATDKPVLVAPTMNPMMWRHAATQRNVARLLADGIHGIAPGAGEMACGETGSGRMAEPMQIVEWIEAFFAGRAGGRRLAGRRAVVTSGPTWEPLDPIRYIANRSSGKQGHAIAAALATRIGSSVGAGELRVHCEGPIAADRHGTPTGVAPLTGSEGHREERQEGRECRSQHGDPGQGPRRERHGRPSQATPRLPGPLTEALRGSPAVAPAATVRTCSASPMRWPSSCSPLAPAPRCPRTPPPGPCSTGST